MPAHERRRKHRQVHTEEKRGSICDTRAKGRIALSNLLANGAPETMDELIGLLVAILVWRTALATLAGLSVALVLAWLFPAFGIGAGMLLTLVALTAGLVWEAKAASQDSPPGAPKAEDQPVSRPIAFLGIAVMGTMWGSVASYLLDSSVIALLLLVALPFVLGPVVGAVTKKPIFLNDLLFAAVALALGFMTPWAVTQLLS
jgi:FtsH-binding integral membrane protein